jgi:hypothetical protein
MQAAAGGASVSGGDGNDSEFVTTTTTTTGATNGNGNNNLGADARGVGPIAFALGFRLLADLTFDAAGGDATRAAINQLAALRARVVLVAARGDAFVAFMQALPADHPFTVIR